MPLDSLPEEQSAAESTEQLQDAELPTTSRHLVELMEQALRQLGAAMLSVRLYGHRHAMADAALKNAHDSLVSLLRRRAPCTLQLLEGLPQFDEVPMADLRDQYRDLLVRARARLIEGISFAEGVTIEELRALAELMQLPAQEVIAGGGPRRLLQQKGVVHLALGLIERDQDADTQRTEEKEQAIGYYETALTAFREVWATAALGRYPEIGVARECVRSIVQSVLKNSSALAGLAGLKRYDDYTHTHSVHVSVYSVLIGKELMLDEEQLVMLGVAGLLHDVGKAEVPIEIVNKPGKLSTAEWRLMQAHSVNGAKILQVGGADMNIPTRAAFEHHIHVNMSGYPKLTRPRKLSFYSLAVTIADFYDALTTVRPYKRAFLPDECLNLMAMDSGIQFEPRLFDYFVRGMGRFPVGSVVQLDTGEYAVVSEVNRELPERPQVKIVIDADGTHRETPLEVDLAAREGDDYRRSALRCVDPITRGINVRAYVEGRG